MKKIAYLLTVLLFTCSFIGCSNKSNNNEQQDTLITKEGPGIGNLYLGMSQNDYIKAIGSKHESNNLTVSDNIPPIEYFGIPFYLDSEATRIKDGKVDALYFSCICDQEFEFIGYYGDTDKQHIEPSNIWNDFCEKYNFMRSGLAEKYKNTSGYNFTTEDWHPENCTIYTDDFNIILTQTRLSPNEDSHFRLQIDLIFNSL